MTPQDVARFRAEGFLAPLRALPEGEMARHLAALAAVEAQRSGRIAPAHNVKVQLLLPFVWALVHDPRIVDRVEALLGPDLLCWSAAFFDKRPGAPHHVTWHQDATYWGLSAPRGLTAWLAFTPSVRENGCMRVLPRSHMAQLPHADTQDRTNMLPGREVVRADVDEAAAVDIVLRPGEMSVHDLLLIHGSRLNTSEQRRCGLAIRYIPADLPGAPGIRHTATLVRGRDHGHFDLEQPPEAAFHPDAMRRYEAILRRWSRGVFGEMARHRATQEETAA